MKLIGRKITLRSLKYSDLYSIYGQANHKAIGRYSDILYPYTKNNISKFINKVKQEERLKKGYHLGIEFINQRSIIGIISLSGIDYKNQKAELEYWLGKEYWGQGIMKEAVKLILYFGFKKLRLKRIYAKIISQNIASWKLLESCGFVKEGVLRKSLFERNKWNDLFIYSMLKDEYKNKV